MGLFLRDMAENIGNRKLRELTDFEWRRNLRFYFHDHEHSMYHQPHIYDKFLKKITNQKQIKLDLHL